MCAWHRVALILCCTVAAAAEPDDAKAQDRSTLIWDYRLPDGGRQSAAQVVDGALLPDGSMLLAMADAGDVTFRAYRVSVTGEVIWRTDALGDAPRDPGFPRPVLAPAPSSEGGTRAIDAGGFVVVANGSSYWRIPLANARLLAALPNEAPFVRLTSTAVAPDGSVWAGGGEKDLAFGSPTRNTEPCSRAVVAHYDDHDRMLWQWRFDGDALATHPWRIIPLSGGEVLVLISTKIPPGSGPMGAELQYCIEQGPDRSWLVWLDAAGRLSDLVGLGTDEIADIGRLSDGRLVVAGIVRSPSGERPFFLRILSPRGRTALVDRDHLLSELPPFKDAAQRSHRNSLWWNEAVDKLFLANDRIFATLSFVCAQNACDVDESRLVEFNDEGEVVNWSAPWQGPPPIAVLPDGTGFIRAADDSVRRFSFP